MKKLKLYQKMELLATLSWLFMDFCWMSNYTFFAIISSVLSISFSYLALVAYFDKKESVYFFLGASFFWVAMNSVWMCGEGMKQEWLIVISKVFFVIVLIFLFIAFYYSKKEDTEELDFKRLKIK